MKRITKEAQIALVAIVGVVVLYFGLQFLKGQSIFSDEDIYYAKFSDISGLSPSSAVYTSGYRVGVVKSIHFDYDHQDRCVAVLGLDKRLKMTRDMRAAIESDMLGNVRVNLVSNADDQAPIAPGDTIEGGKDAGMLDKAASMLPAIEHMLPRLDSIVVRLNTLLADSAVDGTLHNVEHITANLTTTTRQLNSVMATLSRDMPGVMAKADGVLANTQQITSNLSQVDFAATMGKVDSTLANVELLTHRLTSGEGTLGLLINDPALYNNLSATARSADSLLIDLKAHPKRYVHFSVFGKKDK